MPVFRIATLAVCFFVLSLSGHSQQTPPNIVLIISDDQAWNDYSFMGHPVIETPRLDALAARSALFRRGYVPTALCRPSLATLATGLYAHQHGITGNDPSKPPAVTPAEFARQRADLIAKIDHLPTLAAQLSKKQYVSHQSGKWWEGGFGRGGFTHGMTRGFPQPGGRHGDDGLAIGRQGMQPVTDFIDHAVEQRQPFFIWYAPFLPHAPHNPPERLLQKYTAPDRPIELAHYCAMCEWFDETCGQLLDHLKDQDIADNTLIVYVTDNGWIQRTPQTAVPDGWAPQFAPRSKQSPFEGGVRTPIMLCWPGRIVAQDRPELVSSIDLFPTILAAAGLEPEREVPGINLLPVVMDNQPLDRDAIYGESFAHDIADLNNRQSSLLYRWVIHDDWKLILSYDGRIGRYQAVHEALDHGPQLYYLPDDPHEEHNQAAEQPKRVEELSRMIADWWPVDERQVLKE